MRGSRPHGTRRRSRTASTAFSPGRRRDDMRFAWRAVCTPCDPPALIWRMNELPNLDSTGLLWCVGGRLRVTKSDSTCRYEYSGDDLAPPFDSTDRIRDTRNSGSRSVHAVVTRGRSGVRQSRLQRVRGEVRSYKLVSYADPHGMHESILRHKFAGHVVPDRPSGNPLSGEDGWNAHSRGSRYGARIRRIGANSR
jgi:hypothetical protein